MVAKKYRFTNLFLNGYFFSSVVGNPYLDAVAHEEGRHQDNEKPFLHKWLVGIVSIQLSAFSYQLLAITIQLMPYGHAVLMQSASGGNPLWWRCIATSGAFEENR
ncbi:MULTISPECIES: hypothetical protein [Moorena]|uniref:Uncharacterized protein n=1 Tax=Moorena producens 3L TaxID=489825 RepID=F4XJ61_9CYAN|nr:MULTISPECIES: hypothetical protein [Moorena]EGJ35141.1 hypothetical protein LYNGBM3L_06430 [Moorena producens 3L]NEP65024.1 hypothetical protein [Moorena sp. SIO3A5]OLT65199.1 hypothetical protein BI334_09260 [Moorena producens 3L]